MYEEWVVAVLPALIIAEVFNASCAGIFSQRTKDKSVKIFNLVHGILSQTHFTLSR
jgi:hypothetical protein